MFEPRRQRRQVLGQRPIDPDFAPRTWTVEVTAGTHQQAEFARQDRQRADLLGGLHAIDDLDGMPTCLNIVADQLAPLAAREVVMQRMREADPGFRLAQRAYGVLEGRPVLLDVAQLARAQPFAESLLAILYIALLNQEIGEVRTRRRITAVTKSLLDGSRTLQRARHALERQTPVDFFGSQPATVVQAVERRHQRW